MDLNLFWQNPSPRLCLLIKAQLLLGVSLYIKFWTDKGKIGVGPLVDEGKSHSLGYGYFFNTLG
jgi:hypothetical protein